MSFAYVASLSFAVLAAASAEVAQPAPQVDISLAYSRSSCSEDGVGHSVTVGLQVDITNASDRTLIVPRNLDLAPWYRLAASPEDGRLGKLLGGFDGHEVWPGEIKRPRFGRQPDDERFVLLQPGAHWDAVVETMVLATDVPGGLAGFTQAGRTYFLQSGIRMWPFVLMSPADVESLARRWSAIGELITADAKTPFIEIPIPVALKTCEPD